MALLERTHEAFASDQYLTVAGRKLRPGEVAPDFSLDYVDLIDMRVHSTRLGDTAGMVRMLSVVNSLDMETCHRMTLRWEQHITELPLGSCIYTVSMDQPFAQALWQNSRGVIHQALSAWRSERFGYDYGIWLKEWRLLQRSVFVIDGDNHIIHVEYVADQLGEPDYEAAIEAVRRIVPVSDVVKDI